MGAKLDFGRPLSREMPKPGASPAAIVFPTTGYSPIIIIQLIISDHSRMSRALDASQGHMNGWIATGTINLAEIAAVAHSTVHATGHGGSAAALLLGALGVVFGDIGTSPLYTLKECLHAAGGTKATVADLFGILSLMFWSLFMVVTVKYLTFVMRADHNGEGGIFALLATVPERFRSSVPRSGKVTAMALLAVVGASLLYGDGVITPAISVLSAVEGLAIASPRLAPLVLPLTCGILLALFAIQRRGTGDVGKVFGPVMVIWFVTMAGLGIYHIIQRPDILFALSPHHGAAFFFSLTSSKTIGPVFTNPPAVIGRCWASRSGG